MITFVCPACLARWKVVPSTARIENPVHCPNCVAKLGWRAAG